MTRGYWEGVARAYDDEIFDVLAHDHGRVVKRLVERVARPGHIAGDLGCGTGKALDFLSRLFRHVHAADLSAECVRQAGLACRRPNVTFYRLDLSEPVPFPGQLDFALSMNVVLTSDPAVRQAVFSQLAASLKRGGHLVLVVPALESALLAAVRLKEWEIRDGLAPGMAEKSVEKILGPKLSPGLTRGLVEIDGVPTKHYLREELALLADGNGLEVLQCDKAEYGWETEFLSPPSWMRTPWPWDWALLLRKKR
jgi:SAM-dependent methyltransferase